MSERPARLRGRRRILISIAGVLLAGAMSIWMLVALGPSAMIAPAPAPIPSPTASAPELAPSPPAAVVPTPAPTPPGFDRTANSIDDPDSIWVVVNKLRPLDPSHFEPLDLVTANVRHSANALLRAEAARAMEGMFAAAAAEGAGGMMVQNAFRSYGTQTELYNSHVARRGRAGADLTSARPGHSEHQIGLSADIMPDNRHCGVERCFAVTTQGKWLADNAWRFGYHLRYPNGKTPITGYEFEPWHYRYVGVKLATELYAQKVATLEEFFGLPPAPDYAR